MVRDLPWADDIEIGKKAKNRAVKHVTLRNLNTGVSPSMREAGIFWVNGVLHNDIPQGPAFNRGGSI
jgi:hypothetical protein